MLSATQKVQTKKDNNQLGGFGLCAPAIFLQKWDTTKQGEQRGQSGLGRAGLSSYVSLAARREIYTGKTNTERRGGREKRNELPIHLSA